MARKRISLRGMAEAKKDEAVLNARIKRGELKGYPTFYECGCGADHVMPTVVCSNEKDREFNSATYKKDMEKYSTGE